MAAPSFPDAWLVVQGLTGGLMMVACLCAVPVIIVIISCLTVQPNRQLEQMQSSAFLRGGRRRSHIHTNNHTNKKTSISSSFNCYLLFLLLPDVSLNFTVGLGLLWEATHEGMYTPTLCTIRNAVCYFYYFCNLYLNAVVAHQVYNLVWASHRRQKAKPPRRRQVFCEIASVYSITAILAAWFVATLPWSPASTVDFDRCLTEFGGHPSVFSLWTGTLVGMVVVGPPFIYVFHVTYQIYHGNLLPLRGRTRNIAIFFGRIVVVFIAFYIPSVALSFATMLVPSSQSTMQFWILWGFSIFVPTQLLVTLRLIVTKHDIAVALRQFLPCCKKGKNSRHHDSNSTHQGTSVFLYTSGALTSTPLEQQQPRRSILLSSSITKPNQLQSIIAEEDGIASRTDSSAMQSSGTDEEADNNPNICHPISSTAAKSSSMDNSEDLEPVVEESDELTVAA